MLVDPKQCGNCAHEAVCGLKNEVQLVCTKIEEIDLNDREFITITVKCRHYLYGKDVLFLHNKRE